MRGQRATAGLDLDDCIRQVTQTHPAPFGRDERAPQPGGPGLGLEIGHDSRAERIRQTDGQRVQVGLGSGVGELIGTRPERADRADVHDAAAIGFGHPGTREDPEPERALQVHSLAQKYLDQIN
jgi:hypothetical protein